jgi:hypothetical protein
MAVAKRGNAGAAVQDGDARRSRRGARRVENGAQLVSVLRTQANLARAG